MKKFLIVIGVLVAVLAATGAYVFVQVRDVAVEKLSEDLWVLRGFGGNTSVLRTSAGTVIVDTMTFPIQGARIRSIAEDLTGQPAVVLINTHYHLDHTHGNPAFEPGTIVLSTERTLSHLHALDADFWTGDAAELLPNQTFSDRQTLKLGGRTMELVHPGAGHTDGDLVVVFVEERTVAMGDLHFYKHYPNIDLEAGGSIRAWPGTLDNVLALDFDTVIPGHGATTNRAGIRQFQAFMTQLGEIGARAASEGLTVEQVQQSDELTEDAGYEPIRFIISLGLDRAFVLRRAWEEATGNFERLN